MTIDKPTEKRGSKVPEHVPIYLHLCQLHYRWERCAVAASLVDPTKEAQHACSAKSVGFSSTRTVFRSVAREIAEEVSVVA